MKCSTRMLIVALGGTMLLFAGRTASAQDWPQWRGPNRDARATGFEAPAKWPAELTRKWEVTVGDGVATPALVGDRLYVFARDGGEEVLRCLAVADGKELWKNGYAARAVTGAAGGFPGPRSSPTVAEGKVVTLGVEGALSCLDAASGKVLWRKTSTGNVPSFAPSSSPIIVDGLCVAQLGGGDRAGGGRRGRGGRAGRGGAGEAGGGGAIAAFDLATGDEKWKWTGDGTAYASPIVTSIDGNKVVIAETARNIVALGAADGKLLWQTPFVVEGRGYNASDPVVVGDTLVYSGSNRGTTAIKVEKEGDMLKAEELWSSADNSVQYNTPIVKDGYVYGLSASDVVFCIKVADGSTAWTAPLVGRGGRLRGYGSIVDAGSVLVALNPSGTLVVFEPSGEEFKKLASYKVSNEETFAYPVLSGNRIIIKDQNKVMLYTVE
ncbi:MAG: PQQ-binding-like beta-propeller repeat protein [Planctomycetaceae bacterium]